MESQVSLGSDRRGCFEPPSETKEPTSDIECIDIVPIESTDNITYFENMEDESQIMHPDSMNHNRYVMGTRLQTRKGGKSWSGNVGEKGVIGGNVGEKGVIGGTDREIEGKPGVKGGKTGVKGGKAEVEGGKTGVKDVQTGVKDVQTGVKGGKLRVKGGKVGMTAGKGGVKDGKGGKGTHKLPTCKFHDLGKGFIKANVNLFENLWITKSA